MPETKVSPSILAADFANLERDVNMINGSMADYIHVDIMDGLFVPNISFGFPVTKAIQQHSQKPLDFHLMIQNPDAYLVQCADSGARIITVHLEACTHLQRTIAAIKELGVLPGVAINPHTSPELLSEVIHEVGLVLIMSVNPGFGGQSFLEHTYHKVSRVAAMAQEANPTLIIEVDGGVNTSNAPKLVQHGANMLVAGSFVFESNDPNKTISDLKSV